MPHEKHQCNRTTNLDRCTNAGWLAGLFKPGASGAVAAGQSNGGGVVMRIDAEAQLLGVYTHDAERCDAGQPCAMCQWASEQERTPTMPTFDTDWLNASRSRRMLTMEEDARYFWLKGQQAGRLAEQVETRRWLAQLVEGYDERVKR